MNKRSLNIMQVIWGFEVGGAERVIQKLSSELMERGHRLFVLSFRSGGLVQRELENSGVKVLIIRKRHRFDFTILWKMIKVMREHRIDIVNTHLITADIWGRIAALLAGVPVIMVTEHSENPPYRSSFQIQLDKYLSFFTSGIISVSQRVIQYHRHRQNIRPELFRLIYNGLDTKKFNTTRSRIEMRQELGISDPNTVVIGNVARLSPEKDMATFIRTIGESAGNYKNICGLIIGDGKQRAHLEKLTRELNLQEKIIFAGERNDIPNVLQAMDIWMSTSQMEGFSVAVLEAMYSGLPIIANDVGGNNEAIIHNQTGYLVNVNEDKKRYEQLLALILDRNLCHQMGRLGKKRVEEQFTLQKMILETEKIYVETYTEQKRYKAD